MIATINPDILLLTSFDWDYEGRALDAFIARLNEAGADYPHRFAGQPNTGLATGLDLDGNGRSGEARDAQGYGRFMGQGGMALLSRLPIRADYIVDFTPMLWADLPGSLIDGAGLSPDVRAVQRLSTTAHWDIRLVLPEESPLHLWAWTATPPVFDGPEDRNGRRNHDEAALWLHYLEGRLGRHPPEAPIVILGDANLDPIDGEGRPDALLTLLDHPVFLDPQPRSEGALTAAQEGINATHRGDPALDTADWSDDGPGNLRVDYVLPSRDLAVMASGVFWPTPDDPMAETVERASAHRLVWVDVELPSGTRIPRK